MKRFPIPSSTSVQRARIGSYSQGIYASKRQWNTGNEISTRFSQPWLIVFDQAQLAIPTILDALAEQEASEETRIQALYADLNDEVYKLYGDHDQSQNTLRPFASQERDSP